MTTTIIWRSRRRRNWHAGYYQNEWGHIVAFAAARTKAEVRALLLMAVMHAQP